MKLKKLITSFFLTGSIVLTWGQNPALKTHYNSPATNWENEALPVGNGHIGAMVFGGVDEDVILVNEKTLWSGGPVKIPVTTAGTGERLLKTIALCNISEILCRRK